MQYVVLYPGPQGRSVNGGKPWKNGGFTEIRDFSYTDSSKNYRYGWTTERFTGLFTGHRLRSVTRNCLHTVFKRFLKFFFTNFLKYAE
jgi:hypothetical protein